MNFLIANWQLLAAVALFIAVDSALWWVFRQQETERKRFQLHLTRVERCCEREARTVIGTNEVLSHLEVTPELTHIALASLDLRKGPYNAMHDALAAVFVVLREGKA